MTTETLKDFLIKKLIKFKGWDKFEEDISAYGCLVTDKEGNRVDPSILSTLNK